MDYLKMKKEDIGNWCLAHGAEAVAWIKAKSAETEVVPAYPKVRNEKGKMVEDKTQAPIGTKVVRIQFTTLRRAFCEKYMPEILPKAKPKAESMYDYFANL
jgi:hypothetical protein